jgi:hypothetical protein
MPLKVNESTSACGSWRELACREGPVCGGGEVYEIHDQRMPVKVYKSTSARQTIDHQNLAIQYFHVRVTKRQREALHGE